MPGPENAQTDDLKGLRKDFWDTLRQHLREAESPLQPGGSEEGHWLLFKLGVRVESDRTSQYVRIRWAEGTNDCQSYHVEVLYEGQPQPPNTDGQYDPAMSRRWFRFMCERRHELHEDLGYCLDWDNRTPKEIYLKSRCVMADIRDRNAWPGYTNDMRIQAERLHSVFDTYAWEFNEALSN